MPIKNAFPAATAAALPAGVQIQPRRFSFDDVEAVPRYYFAGNPLLTHFENAFSIMIPPGERFFIHSVRAYEKEVSDPEMKDLIRAFIQQEALHGSAHNEYNRAIGRFGFGTDEEIERAEKLFKRLERWLPRRLKLGMTVFLEHLTAVAAGGLFHVPELGEQMDDQMLRFWRWHAAEELEHKSVAFDLFTHVGGGYVMRVCSALVAIALLTVPLIRMTRRMIRADGVTITDDIRREARRINKIAGDQQLPLLAAFFKPGFHPWKLDDGAVLVDWYHSPEAA